MARPTVRGGVKTRKRMKKTQQLKNTKYLCPVCKKKAVVRLQYSVWVCKSCGATIAGGAWALNTGTGKENLRKLALISSAKKEGE
ncbi:50S ribosomal protein L37ae [Candidatus Micrarchaeota archaeon]|nr:50S ribosomal protein L37ae [Candidatus Micrarchaeota archaeon]